MHRCRAITRLDETVDTVSCDTSRARNSAGFHEDENVMVKQVKFVGIPVRDQDKALAFWTKKIGLQIATDQPMGNGQRWIELKIPGAQTGFALFTPDGHENRIGTFQNMSLEVDDVESAYRHLKENGVEFTQPPK